MFVRVRCVCIKQPPDGSATLARPRTLAILTPGKKKDKWEERVFTLTKKGLSWCAALQPTLESARYQHFAEAGMSRFKRRGTNASDRSCVL